MRVCRWPSLSTKMGNLTALALWCVFFHRKTRDPSGYLCSSVNNGRFLLMYMRYQAVDGHSGTTTVACVLRGSCSQAATIASNTVSASANGTLARNTFPTSSSMCSCTGLAAENHFVQPGCTLYPDSAAQQSISAGGLLYCWKCANVQCWLVV